MTNKFSLPKSVSKYFWGDKLQDLNWPEHQDYIIQTILEKGNQETVSWVFSQLNKKELKVKLSQLKLSLKSKNFWSIYLS
ncbi:hypothetical protein KKD62_02070 [Patescibacteria group bacterium]|nr:hypothetical protein [Patescibacteria group bacterium]MBU1931210.1 hypothetical protein [Patescibacteria group bacterium]